MKVKVPQLAWYGPKDLELSFPDSWQVEVCNMQGYDRPALKPDEIKDAICKPIGMPPIREAAKGKKDVVIIFDDMTRVTRVSKIVPFVLEELAAAGVPDNRIRFIAALGLHGAMDRQDFVKKLGEDVVSRFSVYNHNPFGNCVYVGTTKSYLTRVYANEEVMKCDFKIAIGSTVPHAMAGFGSAGKLILPGVVSFETIDWNHTMAGKITEEPGAKRTKGMGLFDENDMRADVDEAADLVGLDMSINAIVNMWGESVAIYAGAMRAAHLASVEEAKSHYLTPTVKGMDIAVANTYAKANEALLGMMIAFPALSFQNNDVVFIANAPDGQVTHYLMGPFGKTTWAKQSQIIGVPPFMNHLIVYCEYPHPGSSWFTEDPKIVDCTNWDDVLRVLQKSHGDGAKVAVFPNSDIQYATS